jgi:hypothetical protein
MSADDDYITEGSIRWPRRAIEAALCFTAAQRAELQRLGVPDVAIRMLEVRGVPFIRKCLEPPPRMSDVRAELRKTQKAILAAHEAIERLFNPPANAPHVKGAAEALTGSGRRHLHGGIPLNRASEALIPAGKVIASAIARLPKTPSRYKAANPRPVDEIADLLHQGCQWAGLPAVPVEGGLPGQITFTPHLQPSASPTSAFRRIVGICYERAGFPTTDPERAIKAYIKHGRR